MKVHELKILRKLESLFNVENVKYDIISKTFIYEHNSSVKEITFYTLLNTLENMELNEAQQDLYNILKALNASYFPRRLKQLFTGLYHHSNLYLPNDLYITTKGIEIKNGETIHYIQYSDDWEEIISDFEKIFDINLKDKQDIINYEDFKGEYHQKP